MSLTCHSLEDREALYTKIGLGALKYYILKVDPKKRILFDPEASVDFNGNTGPFIQYAHARIQSLLRKQQLEALQLNVSLQLDGKEKGILKHLMTYSEVINQAADQFSPALIANYLYELVRLFNSFYQNVSVLGEPAEELKSLRLLLCKAVANNVALASSLLGISVPDRM